MTPTPHGQVPEALIDLIDAYAETRHRYGRIHNAKTEAARNAVIEALSGVQALSAAPGVTSEQRRLIGVIADKIEDGTLFQSGIYPKKDLARFVRNMLDTTPTAPAASPTPPAEQQAAQVIIDFSQVGTAGPFPVANGRVSLPDATMQDLARMLRPTYEAEQQAQQEAQPNYVVSLVVVKEIPTGVNTRNKLYTVNAASADEAVGKAVLQMPSDFPEHRLHTACFVAAPAQPAPAPLSDDTKRLDWLTFHISGKALRDIGVIWSEHGDARRAIDAALAAQGGK